ncbi:MULTISPECIES: type II secretion system F family protein [Streptomyces]|uniref:type II secretion system F family protein n=1 Tax=Streptomyces TaxID=1883 RepID=UPI001409C2CD|nr:MULTISPECIES: type II secretion system F family protein [Streptomyces]MDH6225782.1 pilus assembly protein TadC [Streptomyces sp. MJP52]
MTWPATATVLGVTAALCWTVGKAAGRRGAGRARRRAEALLGRPAPPSSAVHRRWQPGEAARHRAAVLGAVAVCWLLVGGIPGMVVGALAGLVLRHRLGRWAAREAGTDRTVVQAARQLPLAADLLAACVEAGADPVVAARAVGEALGGPLGERLEQGAAEVRLGGEPAAAWRRLAAVPGAAPLARLIERAGESGLPAAAPAARLAAEARAAGDRAAAGRARRAGVLITGPVGLCFLPAFITVGVLPVVIGLAGGALGAGP